MLALALIIGVLTAGSNEVPQAVLERLKNQEVEVVAEMSVQKNGEVLHFATLRLEPYYLIVKLHRIIEGWTFGDEDIYEVFIIKDEKAVTIWARSPPAPAE